MSETGKVFIALIMAIVFIVSTGVMYGDDMSNHDPLNHQEIPDTVIWNQDQCINGYLFRHFYQGERLVSTIQVFQNEPFSGRSASVSRFAKAVTCRVNN